MRRLGVALIALAVGALAGCGGDDRSDARASISGYVQSANRIERGLEPAFKRANAAYRAFSRGKLPPRQAVVRLQRAATVIGGARDRISRLRPPAPARELHRRLVRFLDLDVGLARETATLATYQQRSPWLLRMLAASDRRLGDDLRGATTRTEQAAALGSFGDALGHVLRGMDTLAVPAVVAPAHRAQMRRLRTTRSLAGKLEQALDAQDAARVASLLLRFRRAGAAPSGDALNAPAIRRYNRRFRRLNAAYASVSREEIRLNRSLG